MQAFELRKMTDDWAVVSIPKEIADTENAYFMIWVSEQQPTSRLFTAIQQLVKTPQAIAGVQVALRTEPSMGLILTPLKGWNFEEGSSLQALIDKTLWEINRLLGA